jgi:hypothetical protein
MIPPISSPTTTVKSSLATLSSTISSVNSSLFGTPCPVNYDIADQIPSWVLYEKYERETNGESVITVFDFLQKYYDWLYCDESVGAQYQLSKNLLDLIDIDRTRKEFLYRLASIYANGFDSSFMQENGGVILEENLRKFLKGIRKNFYLKKTTEDGIRYFFLTLFGIDQGDISIQVPKKNILRLNGGKFFSSDFVFSGGTGSYDERSDLAGSYLNGSRIQDSNWFQDWSYLLKVGIDSNEYKQIYKSIVHPAGLKVIYEKELADYQGPLDNEDITDVCDFPILANYAGYGITFNYSGFSAGLYIANGWTSVDGFTPIGISYNTYCGNNGHTGFCGPTHLFPNWTSQPNVTIFGDININTMLQLCYPSDLGSPNAGASCPQVIALP